MRILTGNRSALVEILSTLYKHRELLREMAKREITDRYIGQFFGAIWAIVHPLLMMLLFIFIFAYVFKTKIGGTYEMPLDYTTYILSGLIPWMACQEVLSKSCTVITANANLVKQVVFPLEVLPAKSVVVAYLSQLIATLLLLAYIIFIGGGVAATNLLLPVLLFFQFFALLGFSYFLAVVGVYLRDTKDFIQLFTTVGVYLMPVLYLPEMVPKIFRPLLYLNPFSYLVWCYQDALYFGRIEHPVAWVVVSFGSFFVFVLGYRTFRKFKVFFGNVL